MSDRNEWLDKKIASATVAHMSNAKWRKLFNSLNKYKGSLIGLRLKFIRDERLFHFDLPEIYENEEFTFGDKLPSPYAEFREIDYLFIPKTFKSPKSEPKRSLPDLVNDLDSLILYLETIAKFPIRIFDDGIKILGYEWDIDRRQVGFS